MLKKALHAKIVSEIGQCHKTRHTTILHVKLVAFDKLERPSNKSPRTQPTHTADHAHNPRTPATHTAYVQHTATHSLFTAPATHTAYVQHPPRTPQPPPPMYSHAHRSPHRLCTATHTAAHTAYVQHQPRTPPATRTPPMYSHARRSPLHMHQRHAITAYGHVVEHIGRLGLSRAHPTLRG